MFRLEVSVKWVGSNGCLVLNNNDFLFCMSSWSLEDFVSLRSVDFVFYISSSISYIYKDTWILMRLVHYSLWYLRVSYRDKIISYQLVRGWQL